MNLHKLIFTNNDCYKAGKTMTPKGIMVHSTGANNPNLKRYVGQTMGCSASISTAITGIPPLPAGVRSVSTLSLAS